jgi:pyruvate/2-oxoglutarate dehydrogenase complex dihydrolipoamide acyltransferase (E2) component
LIWIGDSPDDRPPSREAKQDAPARSTGQVTAKAAILLKKHGLEAGRIPRSGDRLTAADVEAYVAQRRPGSPAAGAGPAKSRLPGPSIPGRVRTLNAAEKGMLNTVRWHRDEAVAGYVEYVGDAAPWAERADAYAKERGLMMSPLLGMLAYRLSSLAREMPLANSTIHDGGYYHYEHVNVGFTVQVEDTLYLAVLREAEKMDLDTFLARMGELQRKAFAHKLDSDESNGATIAFSSMARWGIARHVPILPPYTSLIIAHATPEPGRMTLGASYDHRVLSGADVTKLLRALSKPKS